jgi:hypothetical protein
MSWGNSVILEVNEKIINSWKGIWITKEKTLPEKNPKQKKTEKLTDKKKGYLVLTNHRILFLDEEHTMLAVPLTRFVETWMDKTPLKLDCPDNSEDYVFRLADVGKKEFAQFKDLVLYYAQKGDKSLKTPPLEKASSEVSMKSG